MASDRSEVDYGNVCMLKPLNIVNGRRTGRKDYGNQYEEWELRRSGLPCSLFSLVLVVMKCVTAAQARQSLGPTLLQQRRPSRAAAVVGWSPQRLHPSLHVGWV